MNDLTSVESVSRKELEVRQQEWDRLQAELADRELFLASARSEVHRFETRYQERVGRKFKELDQLKAGVLEMAAKVNPDSKKFQAQAETAREQADRNPPEPESEPQLNSEEDNFKPSDELKKQFRDAAKKMHPDLTTDPVERARRHDLMALLNQAYTRLDAEGMQSVLDRWEDGLKPDDDLDLGQQLSRLLKQIGQIRHRLNKIQVEMQTLEQSEMHRLMNYVETSREKGLDVLQDMAKDVDEKINNLRTRIKNLAVDCSFL